MTLTTRQRPLWHACPRFTNLIRSKVPARRWKSSETISPEKNTLSWSDYLNIRGRKRKWEMAATLPTIALCFGTGAAYFGGQEIDASKPVFGLDPLYVYGGATFACAGIGYLLGPILGSQIWRLTHRNALPLIEAREREFHKHIVKNRVDPTAQSATNPVPDFYGEKIGSLRQYRQWLRDQARYKRKAKWIEEEESL